MRAVEAAIGIASLFSVEVRDPVILADSNNVVVWLAPSPVVAKVGTGHHRSLSLELAVARHLVQRCAPVVAPASELPQRVHQVEGFEVTFWEYEAHDRDEEADPELLGRALFELHRVLRSYPGRLASYERELDEVRNVLSQPAQAPALTNVDRELLLSALDRFRTELASREVDQRPLDGSPHSFNVLVADGKPTFIDFETVCEGPVEWDLAHVGPDTAVAYPGAWNAGVRDLCAALVSVKTATWCWAGIEHPELRWHAVHHLDLVKRVMS
ncbi:MAG: aminoglycoside phosphotransferase family protein [Actinomycetota bacterium]|nr:aminoglycoside phosphotransferase family protein [Actinomycetota bacterium]